MPKVVYKYGTGHEVPDGARYLSTQVETLEEKGLSGVFKKNVLVWHYYEVDLSAQPVLDDAEEAQADCGEGK